MSLMGYIQQFLVFNIINYKIKCLKEFFLIFQRKGNNIGYDCWPERILQAEEEFVGKWK